jgi:hypothetical protein
VTLHVTCNGAALERLTIHVPGVGPWFAELSFVDEAPSVRPGAVVLRIGSSEFHGTIPPALDGSFAVRRQSMALAGAGGWGKLLAARGYRNDAGVKASQVARDAAADAGETLGTFAPGSATLGTHYARDAGPAARALEDAAGGVPWFVDYAGVTHVTQRSTSAPASGSYQVLNAWPDRNYVQLGLDDLAAVGVGSILSERLPEPQQVRSLEFDITPEKLRALCFCYDNGSRSKLADALKAIAQRATDDALFGTYRYRIDAVFADRVDLQIVRKASGLPNLLGVPIWPGVAGVYQRFARGAEVLVQFIDGDRAQPAVVAFAGSTGPGFAPEHTTLGGTAGQPAARQGDTVTMALPPFVFTGTIGGVPATGVMIAQTGQTLGSITTGSEKVDVAT